MELKQLEQQFDKLIDDAMSLNARDYIQLLNYIICKSSSSMANLGIILSE